MTPDRFFALLLALQTSGSTTTAELADQVGASVRTVLRDLRWLQEAGFPVYVQRGRWGGVTLLPGGALDTARLTPAERDHLALAGLDEEQQRELGTTTESRRARRKVAPRPSGPPSGPALPVSALVSTDNRPWFGRQTTGVSPAALIGDLRRAVRLRVRYRGSREAEASWRTVDPYGLHAKGGRWYLVADHSRAPHLYSLERLQAWTPLRTPRRLRPGVTLASLARELTSRWEGTDTVRIDGLLDRDQLERARRILGTRLTVHAGTDGERVPITVAYPELEGVRQLLQFAGRLTVTGPPEARRRLRELAEEILRTYE